MATVVRRVEDWLNLVEIHIPQVRSTMETGAVYRVVEVETWPAPSADCPGRSWPCPVESKVISGPYSAEVVADREN